MPDIWIALDGMDLQQAKDFVGCVKEELPEELHERVGFKIGLKFINAQQAGEMISFTKGMGFSVFYDCKLYDIPNTMKESVGEINGLDLGMEDFLNVHASAGIDAMLDVTETSNVPVLAVTILTSFKEDEAHLIYGEPTKAKVLLLARYAKLAECAGVICSPKELEILKSRRELGDGFTFVVPGIRPEWATKKDDQSRVMTPGEAVKAVRGAARNFCLSLVIGRPITKAGDYGFTPVQAIEMVLEEIGEACQEEEPKKSGHPGFSLPAEPDGTHAPKDFKEALDEAFSSKPEGSGKEAVSLEHGMFEGKSSEDEASKRLEDASEAMRKGSVMALELFKSELKRTLGPENEVPEEVFNKLAEEVFGNVGKVTAEDVNNPLHYFDRMVGNFMSKLPDAMIEFGMKATGTSEEVEEDDDDTKVELDEEGLTEPPEMDESARIKIPGIDETPPVPEDVEFPEEPEGPEDCLESEEPLPESEDEVEFIDIDEDDKVPEKEEPEFDLKSIRDTQIPQALLEELYETCVANVIIPFDETRDLVRFAAAEAVSEELVYFIEKKILTKVEFVLAPREDILRKLGVKEEDVEKAKAENYREQAEAIEEHMKIAKSRAPSTCPDCKAPLAHENGVVSCHVCGYSKILSRQELGIPEEEPEAAEAKEEMEEVAADVVEEDDPSTSDTRKIPTELVEEAAEAACENDQEEKESEEPYEPFPGGAEFGG